MAETNTEKIINSVRSEILKVVTDRLTSIKNENHDVAIAWKKMQDIVAIEISKLLMQHLPTSKISSPLTKSTYPDIKIENSEGTFAIDIKVNENTKDPWFDMARLDTIISDRIEKFVEEWELIIKFDTATGNFIKAYFNLFREVVGIRKECDGIKYRPYDGKVRPKSWADFDNDKVYWKTKSDFLIGIEKSLKHRWKENLRQHLIPKLSKEEKNEFRKLFEDKDQDNNTLF